MQEHSIQARQEAQRKIHVSYGNSYFQTHFRLIQSLC